MEEKQLANEIFLVRPARFGFNPETADSNAFQQSDGSESGDEIQAKAQEEFEGMIAALEAHDVSYRVFDDTIDPIKTDAVFPNNWLSTHADGKVILYPMMAPTRRAERRPDIVEQLSESFEVKEIVDLSHYERSGQFCEGTGSLIVDHVFGILYAGLSDRTHRDVVDKIAEELEYDPLYFTANGPGGSPIYHTNVMMSLGDSFAIVCLETIPDEGERTLLVQTLKRTKRQIEEISVEQMSSFAGNVFPVLNKQGKKLLIMSQAAHDSLSFEQRVRWSAYGRLVPVSLTTIEKYGGGSARCMIAGIHLPVQN